MKNENLLTKTKKQLYENLSVKNVTDNRSLWKTVKPYFNQISLIKNDSILTENKDIAKTMNNFFINITKK